MVSKSKDELKRQLVEQIAKNLSEETIKNDFGIVIKKFPSEEKSYAHDHYNIYTKNGDLILPDLKSYDVEEFFHSLAEWISWDLCKSAIDISLEPQKMEETHSFVKILEDKDNRYIAENYVTCPICHFSYDKSSVIHFHL